MPVNTCDRGQPIFQRPATNVPQRLAQGNGHAHPLHRPKQYRLASMDADSFAIVHNHRFRRQERVTVVGTKQSDCFQECRPRIDQFVSRVPKKYPEQYIRDMIAHTGVTPIEVNKLSHDNAMMTSYKVIAWRDEEERLMESDA